MITATHRRAVNALLDHAVATGRAATMAELAQRLGLKSRSTAHRLVDGLRRRGLVSLGPHRPMFHGHCFKIYRVNPASGALERWG